MLLYLALFSNKNCKLLYFVFVSFTNYLKLFIIVLGYFIWTWRLKMVFMYLGIWKIYKRTS
jgi:hypothetical protein